MDKGRQPYPAHCRELKRSDSPVALAVTVVTNLTSPYQVELFNTVERLGGGQIGVVYLHSHHAGRFWGPRSIEHEHLVLDEDESKMPQAAAMLDRADLAVINFYNHRFAHRLLRQRAAGGKGWCFWGERMGSTRWAWAGRLVRRWKLRDLHQSRAAIWGIGEFALEKYREEFGPGRTYINLPYFSDLKRFEAASRERATGDDVRFLFSGSLIHRKGVDLLAAAFVKLAGEFPQARLDILGAGPLQNDLKQTLAGCGHKVRFHGFKDWDELPKFYANADVLCVPSRYDGWALVVPEGLAAGLPVIGTDRTGAALELIKPGENGWLTSAGDFQSLYLAMREAAASRERLAGMSAAARQTVAEHQLEDGAARFISACDASLAGGKRETERKAEMLKR